MFLFFIDSWTKDVATCLTFNPAEEQCLVFKESSVEQFWQRYILGLDFSGLRVLGELGNVNIHLTTTVILLTVFLSLLQCLGPRVIIKIQGASLLLVCLMVSALMTRLLSLPGIMDTVKRILSPQWEALADPDCWQVIWRCYGYNRRKQILMDNFESCYRVTLRVLVEG